MQNITIKINVINIIKKLFILENEINDKKKIDDKNILMKVKIARQEIDLFYWKFFKNFFEIICSCFKKQRTKRNKFINN